MKGYCSRLFIVIWLVSFAVAAVVTILNHVQSPVVGRPIEGRPVARSVPSSMLVNKASRLIQEGGESALLEWVRQIENASRMQVFISQNGLQDLLGRELPEVLQQQFPSSQDQHAEFSAQDSGWLSRLKASNGDRYYIAVQKHMPHSKPVPASIDTGQFKGYQSLWVWLLLTGLISFIIAYLFAKPINRLLVTSKALANGDTGKVLTVQFENRQDELYEIAHNFELMSNRVDNHMIQQQQLFRDVSHELRSPLARLQVAVGLARKRSAGQVEHELHRIETEAEHLNGLVSEILSLARLNSTVRLQDCETFELSCLLKRIVENANFEAGSARVLLICPDEIMVYGNEQLLHRSIENIVRNAVFHTPEHSNAEVMVSNRGQYLLLMIRDFGDGVPDSALPHLFEAFYRVDPSRQIHQGGFGVGLAISQRIIELHGGRIKAENHPSGGLCVSIELPL